MSCFSVEDVGLIANFVSVFQTSNSPKEKQECRDAVRGDNCSSGRKFLQAVNRDIGECSRSDEVQEL